MILENINNLIYEIVSKKDTKKIKELGKWAANDAIDVYTSPKRIGEDVLKGNIKRAGAQTAYYGPRLVAKLGTASLTGISGIAGPPGLVAGFTASTAADMAVDKALRKIGVRSLHRRKKDDDQYIK